MANQKKFYKKYPEGTLQKLTLLRGYVEAWSSLFLTESPSLKYVDHTNRQMYKFCLEKGFAVKVTKNIIKQMMQTKRLVVRKIEDGSPTKNLYINWDNYNKSDRIRFYTE